MNVIQSHTRNAYTTGRGVEDKSIAYTYVHLSDFCRGNKKRKASSTVEWYLVDTIQCVCSKYSTSIHNMGRMARWQDVSPTVYTFVQKLRRHEIWIGKSAWKSQSCICRRIQHLLTVNASHTHITECLCAFNSGKLRWFGFFFTHVVEHK